MKCEETSYTDPTSSRADPRTMNFVGSNTSISLLSQVGPRMSSKSTQQGFLISDDANAANCLFDSLESDS